MIKNLLAVLMITTAIGCSPAQIQKLEQIEAVTFPLVNLGLALDPTPEGQVLKIIAPAGEQALLAMQKDFAARQGVSTESVKQVTDAVVLGLNVTGNGNSTIATYIKQNSPTLDTLAAGMGTAVLVPLPSSNQENR